MKNLPQVCVNVKIFIIFQKNSILDLSLNKKSHKKTRIHKFIVD